MNGNRNSAPPRSDPPAPKPPKRQRSSGETGKRLGRAAANGAAYFLIFLAFVFILGGAAAAAFLLGVTHFPQGEDEGKIPAQMTYVIGNTTYKKVLTEKYFVDGEPYLNFSDIITLCDLSVTGEKGDLTFITAGGETLTLVTGNKTALVNGTPVQLGGTVLDRDGNQWVPMKFLAEYMLGVDFELTEDRKENTILSVTRNSEEVGFLLKPDRVIEKIDLDDVPAGKRRQHSDTPIYTFTNDLSSFYPYMDPVDRDAFLRLSAPSSPTGADFVPDDLVDILNKKSGLSGLQLSLCAEKSLEALFIEMYAAGYTDVTVRTGFRTYETQKRYYDNYLYNEKHYYKSNFASTGAWFSPAAYSVLGAQYLQENYISRGTTVLSDSDAARVTKSYSAAPGTSDHQTGLGVDMHNLTSGSVEFAEEDVYLWLIDNAYKFGFVERYPKDKTEITGFSWEPYHWRFVGQYHAAKMRSLGLCLEEYAEYAAQLAESAATEPQ